MICFHRENKLEDKVMLIKGEIEQLELPVDKVTIQGLLLLIVLSLNVVRLTL